MLRTLTIREGPARDKRLAYLAAGGDEGAFAAIYESYAEPLYRYCHAITRHDEDARDALQGTMLKALRAFSEQEQVGMLKPWLYRIAHNESVSLLRRRRPQAELSEAHEPSGADPHTVVAARAQLFELIDDVAQLPDRQRGMLVMRELEGLSYEEIGQTFAISPEAAKQQVYEARKALAEHHEGRRLSCEAVERVISGGDRRQLRGRRIRAHMRACVSCRQFKGAIPARAAAFGALTPPLPLALSAGLALHGLHAGAVASTAALGGKAAGVVAGIGGWAKGLTAGALTKSVATGAAVVAVGGVTGVAVTQGGGERGKSEAKRPTSTATRSVGPASAPSASAAATQARGPGGVEASRGTAAARTHTGTSTGTARQGAGSANTSASHGGGSAPSGSSNSGSGQSQTSGSQQSQGSSSGSDTASQVSGLANQVTPAAPSLPEAPAVPTPPVSAPLPSAPSLPK
ncbi:MAG: hypothetical protein QOK04_1568 [Solirubrobacteraceae bacterium]|nr:hypothetical protein [Solirubrobacteraceae bacterium]